MKEHVNLTIPSEERQRKRERNKRREFETGMPREA